MLVFDVDDEIYELTFLSMETKDTQTIISVLGFQPKRTNIMVNQLILQNDNAKYEEICNKLKSGNAYRFRTFIYPFYSGIFIKNVYDQPIYEATIKVTSLINLKMNLITIDFDYIKYNKIFHDTNDKDKFSMYKSEINLVTENKNDIIVGKYYNIKFKKHTHGNLYYVYEYERV